VKLGRVGAGAVLAISLGLVFGGCVVFQGPVTVKQVGNQPKVAVKFKVCNSDGDAAEPDCPKQGNSGSDGDPGGSSLGEAVLLGFRVPRGTGLPKRIRSLTPGVSGSFKRLPQYTAQLNDIAPHGPRYRWFGYSASPFDDVQQGNDSPRHDLARFKVLMDVPARIVGKRFKVRPVVGWYDDAELEDGLDCGPDPFAYYSDGNNGSTICIDSPTPAQTRKSVKTKIQPRQG
jgi:hypothetical protein